MPFELIPREKYVLSHQLPKSISGNKLSESMVPGYTGYIPSRKFHFSDTYRAECDQCIDDFMTAKETKAAKSGSINKIVRNYDRHNAIAPNTEVKSFLDYYRDSNPNNISIQCKLICSLKCVKDENMIRCFVIVFKRTNGYSLSHQCPAIQVIRQKWYRLS
jgi:hypothetical protein